MNKHVIRIGIASLLMAISSACVSPPPSAPALSWGDQSDGTYKNPVINGDYSDPDVIRVGSDYYLVSSTFHLSPGVTILHSKDLVNWTIVGHVFDDLSRFHPNYGPDRMASYGHGTWAPAIRHHGGKFWVYDFDFEFGLYMATADDPAGPWTPAHQVLAKARSDDCCPFWDDDGQMYLTYSDILDYGPTGYHIILRKLSPDGRRFVDEGRVILQGEGAEASKILKVDGWYYIFYCANFPGIHRAQMVMRAKTLAGPYEHKMLCKERGSPVNAAQGGLVDDGQGNWWFLHHFDDGNNPLGRTLGLQPVKWIDGWPMIGKIEADGIGSAVMSGRKPVSGYPIVRPATDDEFNGPVFGLQWQWNHAPRNDQWSLTERPGFLRLHATKTLGGFHGASNSLLQRTMGSESGVVTACIETSGMVDNEVGGLCVLTNNMGLLKIVRENGRRFFQVQAGGRETRGAELQTDRVWLRAVMQKHVWQFAVSMDGRFFIDIGPAFAVSGWRDWRGVEVGLFNWNDRGNGGFIDVDWFHYDYR